MSFGQSQSKFVKAQIVDAITSEFLQGATILNLQTGEGTVTDKNGNFELAYENGGNIISIQYLGYFSQTYPIHELPKTIALETNINLIDELTIYAERIPQNLTVRYETIKDFVISENRILMLAKRRGETPVLKLADLDGKVLHVQALPDIKSIEMLFTSCFQTNFLVGSREVLQLHTTQDSIFIVSRDTRNRFNTYIVPCVAATERYMYQEKRAVENQIATITGFDRKTGEQFNFLQVYDEGNIEKYQYEKKYLDFAEGTGPLILGIHALDPKDAMQWGDFLRSNFYLPVDYFLSPKNDTLLLFDHEKHRLSKYSERGMKHAQFPIQYSKEKAWKSKDNFLVDSAKQELYALTRKGSHLIFTRINSVNGQSEERYKVRASFVEKMRVHAGNLYFTNSSLAPNQSDRILKKVELSL